MTYWHDYNPWKDELIYVTTEEWLDCLKYQDETRVRYVQQMERRPFHDLYILPSPNKNFNHSMGMRYGRHGAEYLSPYGDSDKIQALINKYSGPRQSD